MKALCEERGVAFIATCCAYNDVNDKTPQQFEEMCLRAEIPHVAVYPHFTKQKETYQSRLSEGGFDMHYGPEGKKTFAKDIAPAILKRLQ